MDDDKTSEYICNPVTGKNVLKSSVLGKIILKCEKEIKKRRTYLIHYQTGDVNPLNSFFVWTPRTYLFSWKESDVEGIYKNRAWFERQIQYLKSLPLSSLRLLQTYTTNNRLIDSSEKRRELKNIIKNAPPLQSTLYVWRGILHNYINKKPKQLYKNDLTYFISTSLVRNISMHPFFIGDRCCLMKITLSPQCPVLFLPLGESQREMEILLLDESVFTVTHISSFHHRKVYHLCLECKVI